MQETVLSQVEAKKTLDLSWRVVQDFGALASVLRAANVHRPDVRLRNLRVLVVDDHEDARELVALVLENAGAQVTQADSVSVAIKAVAAMAFAIIVSDIGMPVEDGYDLIRRVRSGGASAEARGIPAVAVTAFGTAADRRRALAAGFQEHLAKPFDARQLVEVVANLAVSPVNQPG